VINWYCKYSDNELVKNNISNVKWMSFSLFRFKLFSSFVEVFDFFVEC